MIRAIVFTAALAVATGAAASDSATFRFKHTVPLSCSLTVESGPALDGLLRLTVNERCNDGLGYALLADHATGVSGAIMVDGALLPLSPSGETVLKRVSRAQKATTHVAAPADLSALSLRIAPLSAL